MTLLTALLFLTGCGSKGEELPAPELLNRAKVVLDETPGVHVVATGKDVPKGVRGLLSADGIVTHQPGFVGKAVVQTNGINVDADVTAVDGKIYAKPAFSPVHITLDPARYSIPDPATLIDPASGITSLMPKTQNPTLGDESRQGKTILVDVSGSVSGPDVARLFPGIGENDRFDVTYRIARKSHELHGLTITGPFYGRDTSTYTITIDQYGTQRQITKPS